MFRSPCSMACLFALWGISLPGFHANAWTGERFGERSGRQEEQAEASEDPPRRDAGNIVPESMQMESMQMDLQREDFDGRKRGALGTSTRDGVTTTTARDANREITIRENPGTGIIVEVTRNYGPRDIAVLKKKHPELVGYVEMFPTRVGVHEIEMNLAIKSIYQAATLAELKVQYPEAFNIYRRYRANPQKPVR